MPRHLKTSFGIIVFVVLILTGGQFSFATNLTLDANKFKQAQKALTALAELDVAATARTSFKIAARKHFPELYIKVSSLPEDDLKTELSTAAFLFENAYSHSAGFALADCDLEVRDSYRNICVDNRDLTNAELVLSKARLHMNRARALLLYLRGDKDRSTSEAIAEIKRERSVDLELSQRFVNILRRLERATNSYSSLGEFEAHKRIAKVSFDELSREFNVVAAEGSSLLAALPRTSLTYRLQNAMNSYGDGLFWWQKTYRRREMVVSVKNWTEPPPKNPLGFDTGTIDYAVITFWRKAARNIAEAEVEIERLKQDADGPALMAGGRI